MDVPTNAASVPDLRKSIFGTTRRDFLRAVAVGSTAAIMPITGRGFSSARAASLAQTVDVTLLTAPDLPYPHVPTKDEQDADPAAKAYAEAIQPWLDQNPGVKLEEIAFDVYDMESLLVAISGGTAP